MVAAPDMNKTQSLARTTIYCTHISTVCGIEAFSVAPVLFGNNIIAGAVVQLQ
jgi:hypothetical protein